MDSDTCKTGVQFSVIAFGFFLPAVYVVAIGQENDPVEIQAIAGKTGEPRDSYVLRVQSDNDLDRVADQLTSRMCQW